MKTNELHGAALDYAVAKCVGVEFTYEDHPAHELICFKYSTDWSQGGPIIEEWMIDCNTYRNGWRAARHVSTAPTYGYGPTPLIAAMRCYVKSKMGEEINIPSEVSSI